jgi:N-glycosylase/DNA lyase
MNELLKIELRLMMLRHGRREIIQALASLSNQTLEEIERELRGVEERKRKRVRRVHSAIDFLPEIGQDRPEALETLRTLAARYDARTFLPQFGEVKRFLERSNSAAIRVKSRRDAARQVMTALSRASLDELNRLAKASEGERDSDYAELARQIMGRER